MFEENKYLGLEFIVITVLFTHNIKLLYKTFSKCYFQMLLDVYLNLDDVL